MCKAISAKFPFVTCARPQKHLSRFVEACYSYCAMQVTGTNYPGEMKFQLQRNSRNVKFENEADRVILIN